MRWRTSYLDHLIGEAKRQGQLALAMPSDKAAELLRRALYRRLKATEGPLFEIARKGDCLLLRSVPETIGKVLTP